MSEFTKCSAAMPPDDPSVKLELRNNGKHRWYANGSDFNEAAPQVEDWELKKNFCEWRVVE